MISLEVLQYPFIQRILIGGVLIALLSAILGFFVILRKEHFFGETIAHSALAGIALGVLLGVNPLLLAFIYSFLVSVGLPWLQSKTKLEVNNLLAIILPISTAFGVILFSFNPGYQPELVSFLFGSISWISWSDINILGLLLVVTVITLLLIWPQLAFISIDPQYAKLLGIKTIIFDLIYTFLLTLIIIAGVRLVGIILINTLIIVPMSMAKILSNSLKEMFVFGIIISLICVVVGLLISFILNWPSGAAIALTSGILFFLSLIWTNISFQKSH